MEKPVPDRELTAEEKELVKALTEEQVKEIDEMLLSHVHPKRSRKVAFIVGSTMMDLPNRVKGNQHESTSLGGTAIGPCNGWLWRCARKRVQPRKPNAGKPHFRDCGGSAW